MTVNGCFKENLKSKTSQHIYVVPGLRMPLLGRPAIESLGLVQRIESISSNSDCIPVQYPLLFEGLEKLEGEYKIELMEGAKPYALTTLRRIAIPLLPQVRLSLRGWMQWE